MALTKDKLITRLQTQMGISKQESRQMVDRLLEIMKGSLAQGEDLLISGFGKFSVRQKNARRGRARFALPGNAGGPGALAGESGDARSHDLPGPGAAHS